MSVNFYPGLKNPTPSVEEPKDQPTLSAEEKIDSTPVFNPQTESIYSDGRMWGGNGIFEGNDGKAFRV